MQQSPSPPPGDGKYAGYWMIKRLRRAARNRISAWLAVPGPRAAPQQPLDPARIRRVIVCRRNRRLGNMLFLTPLLRSLAATLPEARIDVLIGDERFRPLFEGLPGLGRVWSMPRRGWRGPFRFVALIWHLHRESYDLVVEPSLNSFSNRLLARLCGARWRLGFQAPDQWLALTHPVTPDPRERHDALRPLELVRAGFASGVAKLYPRLHVALTTEELAAGRTRLTAVLGSAGQVPAVGFFAEATGAKRLPPEWWAAWRAEMQAASQPVRLLQILPPGSASSSAGDTAQLCEPDHRKLAAVLSHLDLFVSADAGPMHLAAATGTPTMGVFRAAKGARYRPLGESGMAVELTAGPARIAQHGLAYLAQSRPAHVAKERRFLGNKLTKPSRLTVDDSPGDPVPRPDHAAQRSNPGPQRGRQPRAADR